MTTAPLDSMDPRAPVIVGVGVAGQRVDVPGGGVEAIELMISSVEAAAADSGATGLLAEVGQVSVPRGTWGYVDPGRFIARRIGAPNARTSLIAAGIPQQTLLDDAYRTILDGRSEVVLVVGGEAAQRAASARRAGVALIDTATGEQPPDDLRFPDGEIVSAAEIDAGVYSPVVAYALIDSALRHAEGTSIAEQRDEIASLWARFSDMASRFPHASARHARSAAELREPGPANPPMAFPYNKLHCAQMNVDQAAAIIVCSVAAARRLGVDPARVVIPLVALESSSAIALPRRRDLFRWPAMGLLGEVAAGHIGRPLDEIESIELYSCFPAAVRVQQRELGIDLERTPTITGGEPFAGGPWNNFVLQATAAMVERVRGERGSLGLVSTVSGFLHKPGLAVYSTDPSTEILVGDLGDRARAATPTVEVVQGYEGPARIAAITVSYDRSGAARTVVIADTPSTARCVAVSDDPGVAEAAVADELIGTAIGVHGTSFDC